MGFKTAPVSSGGSGSSAIEDNSGTPALASGITEAEIRTLLNIEDSDMVTAVEAGATAFATAAQGTLADSAQQPPAEGAFADGDKTKLNGIEASADVTDATNVAAAGALMKTATVNTNSSPAASAADSGEYFYITSGSFTLPNITSVGEQYVVLNNKGSSLSIGKDASDSIVGATSIDDDKVATIVAVTTSTWFVVG